MRKIKLTPPININININLILCWPLSFFLIHCNLIAETQVKPFSTDYCTGYKNRNKQYDWSQCCVEHDFYYWAGGTRKWRNRIDKDFKNCVQNSANKTISHLMYLGIKIGSFSPIKFKGKQWGNAWGHKVRKNKLSHREIELLNRSLDLFPSSELSSKQVQALMKKLSRQIKLKSVNDL